MCEISNEDREHFLIHCSKLEKVRSPFIKLLRDLIEEIDSKLVYIVFNDSKLFTSMLLDVTNPCVPLILQNSDTIFKIEAISRGLIFAVHRERCNYMDITV